MLDSTDITPGPRHRPGRRAAFVVTATGAMTLLAVLTAVTSAAAQQGGARPHDNSLITNGCFVLPGQDGSSTQASTPSPANRAQAGQAGPATVSNQVAHLTGTTPTTLTTSVPTTVPTTATTLPPTTPSTAPQAPTTPSTGPAAEAPTTQGVTSGQAATTTAPQAPGKPSQSLSGVPGWDVGGPSGVGVFSADQQAPGHCLNFVDLVSGSSSGYISQTMHTKDSTSYALSWYMSGDPRGGKAIKSMKVYWDGKVVAWPHYDTTGRTWAQIGWQAGSVLVRATGASSTVAFADTSPGRTPWGAFVDDVSLVPESPASAGPLPVVVNGFVTTSATGPYNVAMRQVLVGLPRTLTVYSGKTPVASITAMSANEKSGGLTITWKMAPTDAFLHQGVLERQASARTVLRCMELLLNKAMAAYNPDLRRDRVLLGGPGYLSGPWAVSVRATSTTGQAMVFTLSASALGARAITASWSEVTMAPKVKSGSGPVALSDMLYYSARTVSVNAPGHKPARPAHKHITKSPVAAHGRVGHSRTAPLTVPKSTAHKGGKQ